MEHETKSWFAGCGCGCLSCAGFFLVVYGLCMLGCFVLWEHFDVKEEWLRGPSVVVWGAPVAALAALVPSVTLLFVIRAMAFKRFARKSSRPSFESAAIPPVMKPSQDVPGKAGCLMPSIWLGLGLLATVAGVGFVAVMAAESERDGVTATLIAAGPIGLAWVGMLAAAVIHLAYKRASTPVRVVVPIVCGVAGGLGAFALALVFFSAIWPSL
ncbi:MAG: hypothetical protein FJ276_13970 [Planctomycetes bacterium]|nr:hypothetical protein [Planctomycetota bacterium]